MSLLSTSRRISAPGPIRWRSIRRACRGRAALPTRRSRTGWATPIALAPCTPAGPARSARARPTLFGDSLTAATVYPQCAEAAFGTLSVDAFGYPSMRTDFGRGKVKEILDKENPEFMFILYGTNNSKAAEGPATGHGGPGGDRPARATTTAPWRCWARIPPRGWAPDSQPEADYNAELVKLCQRLKIPAGYIFEGFQAAGPADRRKYLGDDGVHWRGEGMEIAGRAWGKTLDQIRFVLRDQR